MRLAAITLAVALCTSGAAAQDTQSLASIRQDLSILTGELARLKQELAGGGPSSVQIGGGTLDRVNAIEAALQQVTARTEQLQHRIETVVQDGTNRIGDLQFRLCELEPGCDIGALGDTPTLGGATAATGVATAAAPPVSNALPSGGAELAVTEETDFRRAREALASGDFQGAAQQFATFRETFPGSPLEAAALVGEGNALTAAGDTREAARRFLSAYASYPDSEAAPEALWRLGAALGQLGNQSEACVTLSEVETRYPGTAVVAEAQAEMDRLGCQ
ncbi:tol-pal system protein [Salipiger aestuarii]|uniref:Cell division coordinator CpoB n=1 Tax=Salipiger aestuarii TaxID=568098 RepID=A0A327XXW2_9RHOB|nr:tol-pal system protein YbgF [Salipiger aestuarii]EIE50608.1 tol-pal system protein YbgF [Citreicella sp. 357]KAB2540931.1 tol-pal system protein [Salipiger aestuarii]RAK12776.1 tol-pal system protein YbgF [Salipiger aestuarii]